VIFKNSLVQQLLIAFTIVALSNAAVWSLSSNSVPRALLRRLSQAPPADCLILGDSTMEAAFHSKVFLEANPQIHAINAALGATSATEHWVLFQRSPKAEPCIVTYGFFETKLTDSVEWSISDLIGNRCVMLYAETAEAVRLLTPNRFKRWFLSIASNIPFYTERGAVWSKIKRVRQLLAKLGMPHESAGRFGLVENFRQAAATRSQLEKQCQEALGRQDFFNGPFARLLEACRSAKHRLVVVNMPMPSERRVLLSSSIGLEYRRRLQHHLQEQGCYYIDASDWLPDSDFEDVWHANTNGAERFTQRLATQLPR
jgi:hypothetical protein